MRISSIFKRNFGQCKSKNFYIDSVNVEDDGEIPYLSLRCCSRDMFAREKVEILVSFDEVLRLSKAVAGCNPRAVRLVDVEDLQLEDEPREVCAVGDSSE